jgi:hypothetical protein
MFSFADLNWWAILVSMVVCVISGSIWYNPKTFFPVWWKGIGKTEKDIPGNGSNMKVVFGLTFVSAFIQPLLFAVVLHALFPDGASLANGILTALVVWAGFVAPTYLVNKLFAGQPGYVWAIEVSNHLLNFVLFGIILSVWN